MRQAGQSSSLGRRAGTGVPRSTEATTDSSLLGGRRVREGDKEAGRQAAPPGARHQLLRLGVACGRQEREGGLAMLGDAALKPAVHSLPAPSTHTCIAPVHLQGTLAARPLRRA